jgi:hypothetical protein
MQSAARLLYLQQRKYLNGAGSCESGHACGTVGTQLPRFRALTLFGRRLPECVEGRVIPTAENLHSAIATIARSHRNSIERGPT